MLSAVKLPEFLWEPAVAHAAYLRNRSYTTAIAAVPYQRWYGKKPDVTHLQEFGSDVWVLHQGQKVQRKMLPKSQRRAYIGHDDGSKAIKYYQADSRKILISRNFRFLSLSESPEITSTDTIRITLDTSPAAIREGGDGGMSTHGHGGNGDIETQDTYKRKWAEIDQPRKTRGNRVDYQKLHDPFSDHEDGDEQNYQYNVTDTQSDPLTLKDAKASDEWPEWEKAIHAELEQLNQMGTWKLIEKPINAQPIANKWVFVKKRDKSGQVTKYKARLVTKGCAQ